MLEFGNYALNLWLGYVTEPIDWEAKRKSDEQRVNRLIAMDLERARLKLEREAAK